MPDYSRMTGAPSERRRNNTRPLALGFSASAKGYHKAPSDEKVFHPPPTWPNPMGYPWPVRRGTLARP
jgi:hypothetical protein